ncbi:MAG: DNA polymerase III subunit gamma/tau [Pelistega sp.]|nr:DNA polymerase III subunit gamma/tau [Pelistega sp.]
MSYLVLARKWRPRSFDTLVGQDHVVKALSNALSNQRLHHAWLFTGTRGVGKTTLARILAKSLNCEQGISATPCGVCQACTEIDAGRFPDYLEFDAASNRSVESMTQLLEQAIYAPSVGRFKVYTIDEVHMLTGFAFNAMLKTLEEPPPHVKFILATTDPQKIPVTVLSRCLQFNLKQMAPESIVGHLQNVLQEEAVEFELEGLRLLAQAAAGSMRDALSLTDQAIAYSASHITGESVRDMLGTIDQRYLVRFLEQLLAGSAQGVVAVADELSTRGYSFSNALSDFASLLSQIAIEQRLPGTINEADPACADIQRLAQQIHADTLQLFYSIALHSRAELALAPDEYTGFMMAGLRMLSLISTPQAQAVQAAPHQDMASPGVSSESAAEQTHSPVANESDMAEKKSLEHDTLTQAHTSLRSQEKTIAPTINSASKDRDTSLVQPSMAEQLASPKSDGQVIAESRQGAASIEPTRPIEPVTPIERVAPIDRVASTESVKPTRTIESIDPVASQAASESLVPTIEDIPPWEDIPALAMHEIAAINEAEQGEAELLVQDEDPSWVPLEREEQVYSLAQMTPELWVSLVPSLQLSGMVGELARHSEWVGLEGNTIRLRLLVRLPDNLQARNNLTTRLTEYFKTIIKVKFEFGQTGDATLHAQELAEQETRMEQAKQAVQSSPLVQAIVQEFDGLVVPDSIQPY